MEELVVFLFTQLLEDKLLYELLNVSTDQSLLALRRNDACGVKSLKRRHPGEGRGLGDAEYEAVASHPALRAILSPWRGELYACSFSPKMERAPHPNVMCVN